MSKEKKQPKNYVVPELFRLELIASNVKGELTPKCIEMFQLMITKIQSSFFYVDPQDKEDCASEAMMVLLTKWKHYDCDRQNAFAFFTRTIYNGLFAGWNKLNRSRTPYSYSNIFTEST
jgi:hypothetical protein